MHLVDNRLNDLNILNPNTHKFKEYISGVIIICFLGLKTVGNRLLGSF